MADLTGKRIQNTYGGILNIGSQGVSGTLQTVTDGFGNPMPFQISDTTVNFTGNVTGIGITGGYGATGPTGAGGVLGYYGIFLDTTTQTNASPSAANVFRLNTTLSNYGVSIVDNSKITVSEASIFNIQAVAQFYKTSPGDDVVQVWLSKNGVNVVGSNKLFTLNGAGAIEAVTLTYQVAANTGDYYQIYWSSTDTTMQALFQAASTLPNKPATSSVSVSVTPVAYTQVGMTGAAGSSGSSGSSGSAGTSGSSGSSGSAGSSGTSGSSGSAGTSGSSGSAGTSGSSGSAGTSGSSGSAGSAGTSGSSGSAGTSGSSGSSGSSGTSGIDGTSGSAGTSGSNGSSGTSGSSGESGTSGSSGSTGSSGTSGVDGTSGTSGINGATGATGTGLGLTTKVIPFDTQTDPWTYITAPGDYNSTSYKDFTFAVPFNTTNYNIDVQITYSPAITGLTGFSQSLGDLGGVGAYITNKTNTGFRYYVATQLDNANPDFYATGYVQCIAAGETSVPGQDGSSGSSGSSGISGSSGSSGINGSSGSSGISGSSGSSGIDGSSGTSGIDGSSGTSGIDGTSGTSGINGATGATGSGGNGPVIKSGYAAPTWTDLGSGIHEATITFASYGYTNFPNANYTITTSLQWTTDRDEVVGIFSQSASEFVVRTVILLGGTLPDFNWIAIQTGDLPANGSSGTSGISGSSGTSGASGQQGNRAGLQYEFSTSTSSGNPGSGILKFNNSTLSSVTQIILSTTTIDSLGVASILNLIDDSNSTIKSIITITSNANGDGSFFSFQVTSVTTHANYYELNGTFVAGSAFSNSEIIAFNFTQTGNSGSNGSSGTSGVSISGPTGPLGPTGPAASSPIGFSGTGGVAISNGAGATGISKSILIPGGTYTSGDAVEIMGRFTKASGTTSSPVIAAIYLNSSDTITGAKQIGQNLNNFGANAFSIFSVDRSLAILDASGASAESITSNALPTTSTFFDLALGINNSAVSPYITGINWANDVYVMFTLTNTNVANSGRLLNYYIQSKKGIQGATGPAGAAGATGPSGGPIGPTGPTGANGSSGTSGINGATGAAGAGGLDYPTSDQAVLAATGAATNINVAVVPKGTGAFTLQVPDGTTAGGNARGTNAVDLSMKRDFNADKVASGNYAFQAGNTAKASGENSAVLGGYNCNASAYGSATVAGESASATAPGAVTLGGNGAGAYAFHSVAQGFLTSVYSDGANAIGNSVVANSDFSHAGGRESQTAIRGQFSRSGGAFSSRGDAQTSIITVGQNKALAASTLVKLTTDPTTTSTSSSLGLTMSGSNRSWAVNYQLTYVCTATTGGGSDPIVGDTYTEQGTFFAKTVGGTTTATSPVSYAITKDSYYTGGLLPVVSTTISGNEVQFNVTSGATTNTNTYRILATISITEVAW